MNETVFAPESAHKILRPFSETQCLNRRWATEAIVRIGDHYCATDTKIAARVPVRDFTTRRFPPVHEIMPSFEGRKWRPMPELETTLYAKCDNCGGCGLCDTVPCESCDGEGYLPANPPVKIDGHYFDHAYLEKIARLPNPEISVVLHKSAGLLLFKASDGMEGCLMPLALTDADVNERWPNAKGSK